MHLEDDRPAGIAVLVVLFALEAAAWFALAGLWLLLTVFGGAGVLTPLLWAVVAFLPIVIALLLGLAYVEVARDLWGRERWAWPAAIALSALAVASGPLALVLSSPFDLYAFLGVPAGLASLVVLFQRSVSRQFGHPPPRSGGRASVENLPRRRPVRAGAVPLDEAGTRAAMKVRSARSDRGQAGLPGPVYPVEGRPSEIAALVALFVLEGCVFLALAAALVALLALGFRGLPLFPLFAVSFSAGVLDFVVAKGLWDLAGWSLAAAVLLATFGLLLFPPGTIIGLLVYRLLSRPAVRLSLGDSPGEVYGPAYAAYAMAAYPNLARARAEESPLHRGLAVAPASFCVRCGTALDAANAFCRKCGSRAA